ncbi:MAG TPA: hypothetical protein VN150_17595, partial [Ochrobactrum sp.]|nr:hypothetical protein [Ochrobactrum sp.]
QNANFATISTGLFPLSNQQLKRYSHKDRAMMLPQSALSVDRASFIGYNLLYNSGKEYQQKGRA